jgi:hypothetical protein
MNEAVWKRFPTSPDMHCVGIKDRVQGKVMEETRHATPETLVAYFRNASRRFWMLNRFLDP